jgi:3-phenylpropionate/cinnamic acid dioxygenase small subunit
MDAAAIILINQLLANYGHLVDDRQFDRFDELFVEDALLDYRAVNVPEVMRGLEAIKDFFRAANHPSAHHCTNVYVYRDDGADVTRVKSKFVAPYTREQHTPRRWYGGDYDDVVVETDAGWRFLSRTCSARWQFTADAEPMPEHRRTW